jgi:hypothetical protein
VACAVDRRVRAGFWWGDLRRRDLLEDLGVDVIFKWILKKQGWR